MLELSIWWRLIILIVGWAFGFWFLLKPLQVVNIIGKSEWSEEHFPGGTFGAVQAFGLAIIILCVWVLFKG